MCETKQRPKETTVWHQRQGYLGLIAMGVPCCLEFVSVDRVPLSSCSFQAIAGAMQSHASLVIESRAGVR